MDEFEQFIENAEHMIEMFGDILLRNQPGICLIVAPTLAHRWDDIMAYFEPNYEIVADEYEEEKFRKFFLLANDSKVNPYFDDEEF